MGNDSTAAIPSSHEPTPGDLPSAAGRVGGTASGAGASGAIENRPAADSTGAAGGTDNSMGGPVVTEPAVPRPRPRAKSTDDKSEPKSGAEPAIIARSEKWALYGFLALIILGVGVMQIVDTSSQQTKYQSSLDFAKTQYQSGKMLESNYLNFQSTIGPAEDLLSLRHAGLFFGMVIIALGAMVVVTGVQAGYSLNVDTPEAKGTLATASPGLVLITLGMVLAIAALYRTTSFQGGYIEPSASSANIAEAPVAPLRTSTLPPPPKPVLTETVDTQSPETGGGSGGGR